MKLLIAAAMLAVFSVRANAEPVSTYEQNFQGYTRLSLGQLGDYIPTVYLPAFNQNLGMLQAVQIGLNLSNDAEFTDEAPELPNPPPTSVKFTFGLSLFYGGEYTSAPVVESVAPYSGPGTLSASAYAAFSQLFFASTLSPFETNCTGAFYCESSFFIDPYVITSIDNAETQDFEDIAFDLSETFYYAPATAISEPDSTSLLLIGCLGSIAIARYRGRRALGLSQKAAP